MLGCGRDIKETPTERRSLGEGSYKVVDGVVNCWRSLGTRLMVRDYQHLTTTLYEPYPVSVISLLHPSIRYCSPPDELMKFTYTCKDYHIYRNKLQTTTSYQIDIL